MPPHSVSSFSLLRTPPSCLCSFQPSLRRHIAHTPPRSVAYFSLFHPPYPAHTALSLVRGSVLPTHRFVLWLLFFCFIPSCSYSLKPSARQCVAHMPLRSVASFFLFHPHLAHTASSLVQGGVLPTCRFILRLLFLCFTPPSCLYSLEPSPRWCVAHMPLRSAASFSLFHPPSCLYSLEPSARWCVAHTPLHSVASFSPVYATIIYQY